MNKLTPSGKRKSPKSARFELLNDLIDVFVIRPDGFLNYEGRKGDTAGYDADLEVECLPSDEKENGNLNSKINVGEFAT